MSMSPKDMMKPPGKNGFRIVPGGKGSHQKLRHPDGRSTLVPVHSKELKKGLEQAILKQAGLK